MTPTVYFVRHGATDLNGTTQSVERIRGWKDVPLNPDGIAEANRVAKLLENKGIKKIYSSDLSRAYRTAKIIAKRLALRPVVSSMEFRPWNLGDWQGKPTKEVLDDMIEHQENPDEKVPGGETWREFLDRYLDAMRDVMHESEKIGPIAVVAHYRNLKTAEAWLKDGVNNDKVDMATLQKNDSGTGSIFVMKKEDGTWKGSKLLNS